MSIYEWAPAAFVAAIAYTLAVFYGIHVFLRKKVKERGRLQYLGGAALVSAVPGTVAGLAYIATLWYHYFRNSRHHGSINASHSLWALLPAGFMVFVSGLVLAIFGLIAYALVSEDLWDSPL